jgi:hypothetical protein
MDNVHNFDTNINVTTASVVYWSEFLATDPDSIPCPTRFSGK